jgi:hypothetical protein
MLIFAAPVSASSADADVVATAAAVVAVVLVVVVVAATAAAADAVVVLAKNAISNQRYSVNLPQLPLSSQSLPSQYLVVFLRHLKNKMELFSSLNQYRPSI